MIRTLVVVLGLCTAAAGQSAAASETHLAQAQEVVMAGGESASPLHRAQAAVGEVTTGFLASSPIYKAEGGVVWAPMAMTQGPPWLIGVLGNAAPVGGQSVTVVGFNLEPELSLSTEVFFGDEPAMLDGTITNTTLPVFTPTGLDALRNPVGPAALTIYTTAGGPLPNYGFDTVADVFAFLPALTDDFPGATSGPRRLRVTAAAGPVLAFIVAGTPAAGDGTEISGFDGALTVGGTLHLIGPLIAQGDEVQVWLPDPKLAAGSGSAVVRVQAALITSLQPLHGRFTNPIDLPVTNP